MHVYFDTAMQGQPRDLGVDGITVQQGNFTVTAMVERTVTDARTMQFDRDLQRRLYSQTLENGVLRFTRPAPQTAQIEATAQADRATPDHEQPTTSPDRAPEPVEQPPLLRSLLRHATTRDEEASGRRPIRHWQLFDLTLDTDAERAANSIRGMLDAIEAANPGLTFDAHASQRPPRADRAGRPAPLRRTTYKASLKAKYERPAAARHKAETQGRSRFNVDFSRHAWTTSLSDEAPGTPSDVDPTGPLGTERTNIPAQLQLGAILTPDGSESATTAWR